VCLLLRMGWFVFLIIILPLVICPSLRTYRSAEITAIETRTAGRCRPDSSFAVLPSILRATPCRRGKTRAPNDPSRDKVRHQRNSREGAPWWWIAVQYKDVFFPQFWGGGGGAGAAGGQGPRENICSSPSHSTRSSGAQERRTTGSAT